MSKLGIFQARVRASHSGYKAKAVHFDGSTFLVSAWNVTNCSSGLVSYWGKQAAKDELAADTSGDAVFIQTDGSQDFSIGIPMGGNGAGVIFEETSTGGAGRNVMNVDLTNTDTVPVGSWFHGMLAWNTDAIPANRLVSKKTMPPKRM
jgi:hypothetical protein